MGKVRESAGVSGLSMLTRAVASYEKTLPKNRRHSKRAKEAAPAARADGLLSIEESEHTRLLEKIDAPSGEGPRIKVLLIDEGLGNRRTMNYYGPEAIKSAVEAFEGKPCFLNHPSESEERDLPERSVRSQCGYYKNLRVEEVDGKSACVGELHFDLTEDGAYAYAKALTALHYQKEFPKSPLQYVGWSVLGGGKGDRKTMTVEGEKVEVNYVTEFSEGDSCDMVTRAGRGGRALGVMESARRTINKEDGMKKLKDLKLALKSIEESAKAAKGAEKAKLEESAKTIKATIKALEADDAGAADDGDDDKHYAAMCAKREGESDEDHKARMNLLAKHVAKHLSPKEEGDGADDDSGAGDGDGDGDKPKETAAPTAEESDRNTRAVKAYMAEAGVPEGALSEAKIKRLARMKWSEAKAEIDDVALLAEKIAESVEAPVAHLGGAGAGKTREAAVASRSKSFAKSFKEAR